LSPTLLFLVFLTIAIQTGMRRNLSVILICISFMTKDAEHFFIYLLPFLLLESCLFNSFAHLVIWLFVLLMFIFLSSFCILDVNFWWIASKDVSFLFCKLFLGSGNYFLWYAEVFNLMQSYLSILVLISWATRILLRKSLPMPISSSVFPVVISKFQILY
jgi:hypothetical protein